MRRITLAVLAALFAATAGAATGNAAARPALTFKGTTLRACGFTPGATIVIYGAAKLRVNYNDIVRRYKTTMTDDDRDGCVSYDVKPPTPRAGVFVAIDTTNGDYVIASPERTVVQARPQPQPLRRHNNGVDGFSFAYPSLDLLYVHPGKGVWISSGVDGAVTDRDPAEAVTGMVLDDAVSLLPRDDSKPKEFSPGGVVIAIDSIRFDVFTMRLTPADLGGAR